jgi:hypothetical protein
MSMNVALALWGDSIPCEDGSELINFECECSGITVYDYINRKCTSVVTASATLLHDFCSHQSEFELLTNQLTNIDESTGFCPSYSATGDSQASTFLLNVRFMPVQAQLSAYLYVILELVTPEPVSFSIKLKY